MEEFDYIIIGGGSAGCVAAARLSENPKNRVLLLEAGKMDSDPWIHIPATFFKVIEKGEAIKIYKSDPDSALNGRNALIPQGYVLGGGSSVNAMIYIRGNARDYDLWAQNGNTAWSYDKVLPIFRDLEHNLSFNNEFHGNKGELCVSSPRFKHPLSQIFVKAALEAGLPLNQDFNGAEQEGVGFYQTTTHNGRRCSSAVAFLHSALHRKNLKLVTGQACAKIQFEGTRAVGIVTENGTRYRCLNEVVLSAGALESPRLLQISGIGNRDELQGLDIPVVSHLPGVGENFQDHFETPVQAQTSKSSLLGQDKGLKAVRNMLHYLINRGGILSTNVVASGGFARVGNDSTPDIQFHVLPMVVGFLDRQPELVDGITINPCLLRPRSRGSIKITSNNPKDPPRFNCNMLSDPLDMEIQKRGVQLALRILNAPSLAKIVNRRILPDANIEKGDDRLVDYIRNTSKTVFHPSGTCKMGTAEDKMSVVGQDLKVRGVQNLRVADISIMPTLVSGNTNASAMMIGERCSRFILGKEMSS